MAFTFFLLSERLTNFFLKIVFGTLETCYDASSYALFSLAGVFVLLYSNFFGGGQIAKKETIYTLKAERTPCQSHK